MHQRDLFRARVVASIAATTIALACGTSYVYSAWAPQFADKLKLSATQSNLIGLFGNVGMYATGPPVGIFIDHQRLGPRPAVLAGAFLMAVGYFPLYRAYATGSGSVPLLCFYNFLTGWGSCLAFLAAVKTSAINWPQHRGTATAFPLAAFGLSAFFFSFLGSLLFPGNPSAFLELLSWGTSGLTLLGFFFLKTYSDTSYEAVPDSDADQEHRFVTHDARQHNEPASTSPNFPSVPPLEAAGGLETSPLVSGTATPHNEEAATAIDTDRSLRVDIRGIQLLFSLDFWQLFAIMAILSGVGLMTINNIGNDVNALWKKYDEKVGEEFLVHRQQLHVSILSVCSFVGRLLSGIGSDFLVKKLQASRVWCLFLAGVIFLVAQFCAVNITSPLYLFAVSSLSGMAYGLLFGVFPSIVAETFGIRGMSQNWGFMTIAPVISGNMFNLFYGTVYDHHSIVEPDGKRNCHQGLECYRSAYLATFSACAVGLVVILAVIRHQYLAKLKETNKAHLED
ncbi:hypothetical protein VHEMI00470 [[Torrubiella] hemipterigena]|uniref:Nodulin-like domain-containing protein n=1 Tax=[Torrubiella] hemipterigena TaxID=1531966 RepID=A0A0A1T207_9HYPO|nr:hypothetical protein VHEMI00470 [[Torrubiella] hemipterigena]